MAFNLRTISLVSWMTGSLGRAPEDSDLPSSSVSLEKAAYAQPSSWLGDISDIGWTATWSLELHMEVLIPAGIRGWANSTAKERRAGTPRLCCSINMCSWGWKEVFQSPWEEVTARLLSDTSVRRRVGWSWQWHYRFPCPAVLTQLI